MRDVIDIWLLEALLEPDQLAEVKAAAIETFARRQLHTWPPAVEASASWNRDYPRLIDAHPGSPGSVDDAVRYLAAFIARIDNTA